MHCLYGTFLVRLELSSIPDNWSPARVNMCMCGLYVAHSFAKSHREIYTINQKHGGIRPSTRRVNRATCHRNTLPVIAPAKTRVNIRRESLGLSSWKIRLLNLLPVLIVKGHSWHYEYWIILIEINLVLIAPRQMTERVPGMSFMNSNNLFQHSS